VPPPTTASAKPEAPKPTMAEMQQASLKSALEALNAHDAKKFASAYAEDAVVEVAGLHQLEGRAAVEKNMQEWFDTFSKIKLGFSRVFMKGDVLVAEWVINGTHSGELFGVKGTETPIGHLGLSVIRFNPDGLVKSEHRYGDLGTVMDQIGASKAGKAARPIPTIPATTDVVASKGTPDEDKNVEIAKAVYAAMEKKSEADFVGKLTDDVEYDGLIHFNTVKGKDEGKKFFKTFTTAFPDAKFEVVGSWGFGDLVVTEQVLKGTHKGPIDKIPASNRGVAVHAVDIFKVKDGKVARAWTYTNTMELATQVGMFQVPMVNAPAGAGAKPAAPPAPKK
jgi:steroid delta-isomerase-like uncharacterized protein/uncharacterized protein (TIGR02246 family)